MSPAEAGELLDEPDWAELWKVTPGRGRWFRNAPAPLAQMDFTPLWIDGVQKKKLAPSVDGVIALAQLGIIAISGLTERPPGAFEEQADAMCWLSISGRAWRIVGIEDHMLFLNGFGEEKQIDLNKAKWEKHTEAAVAVLEE